MPTICCCPLIRKLQGEFGKKKLNKAATSTGNKVAFYSADRCTIAAFIAITG